MPRSALFLALLISEIFCDRGERKRVVMVYLEEDCVGYWC